MILLYTSEENDKNCNIPHTKYVRVYAGLYQVIIHNHNTNLNMMDYEEETKHGPVKL